MTDVRKLYANVNFEINKKENENDYLERQELAYKYFYHINKSSKILNDPKALNAINFTHSNLISSFINIEKQIELSIKYDFTKIILTIIENCYQRIIECIHFITEVNEINDKNRIGSMAICLMAVEILEKFTYYSKLFSIRFQFDNENSFKTIFNLINNRKIQNISLTLFRTQPNCQELVLLKGIFKSIFSSIVNLTRHSNYECKQIWNKNNSMEIFENYLTKMNSVFNIKIYIYLIMAYLMGENLTEDIIRYLAGIYSLIVNNQTKSNFRINPIKKSHQISYISKSGHLFNQIDLIQILYKLSCIDKFKQLVYFKYKLKKYLIRSIFNSTEFELTYCLDLLWLLIYDAKIANDVKKDDLLIKFIESLSRSKSTNKLIQNISFGILWQLSYRFELSNKDIHVDSNNNRIMIINQSDNIELCLLIQRELDRYDYRTFFDSNKIICVESGLENIKNSFCVVICLDENFNLDTGLRELIEYAFKLNKPIIPLIMQKSKLKGLDSWLDEFLKRKIIFYFYKSSFNLCFNGLIDHINLLESKRKLAITGIKNHAIYWEEEKVEEWLTSKNINKIIIDNIIPCNGFILFELYLISLEAPNYFYQHISNIKDDLNNNDMLNNENILINISDFTLFKKYLKELFE